MKKMKRWVKVLLCIVLALVLVVGAYVAYVFIDYHRIGDMELTPEGDAAVTELAAWKRYTVLSYNIGFGAYEDDYGFFMDGGTESWAWSKERLTANVDAIAAFLARQQADFCLYYIIFLQKVNSIRLLKQYFFQNLKLIYATKRRTTMCLSIFLHFNFLSLSNLKIFPTQKTP